MSKLSIFVLIAQLSIMGFSQEKTKRKITSSERIEKNHLKEMKATEEVLLKDGFIVEKGSSFVAKISKSNTPELPKGSQLTMKQFSTVIEIHPNPTSDFINISTNPESANYQHEVVIIDMGGKEILRTLINKSNNHVDLSSLRNGSYVLKVVGSSASPTKIIKQ